MPKIIDTIRFFEWGKQAPKNSRFKGIMNDKMIFGYNGYMDYTGRKDAVEENIKDQLTLFEDGFIGYTAREGAASGSTVSSIGVLTPEKRKELRRIGSAAFNKPGDLIWDMVISMESYEEAHKNHLYHQADYAAVIEKILPQFFRKVGFDPQNMIWWMDYHNNKKHPHMHVVFMEKIHTRDKGSFTEKQLKTLKQIIAKEMTVRETIRELTGNDYETQFRLKDQEKEEMMEALHTVDFSKIDSIKALAAALPRSGRMQYGSYNILPYRESIDRITDQLLQSDHLKKAYEDYLRALDPLDQAMKNDADESTIRKTELKKLHSEIGNIILREIRKFQDRPVYRSWVSGRQLVSWMDETEDKERSGRSEVIHKEYEDLRKEHREALESSQRPNKAIFDGIYYRYEEILNSDCDPRTAACIHHKLAQMEFFGEGTSRNLNLAKMHCLKAIEEGSIHSYPLMAKICFARKEITEGMNALYAGMANGDGVSEYMLGIEMIYGKRTERDKEGGYRCLISSAVHGFQPAVDYLDSHNPKAFDEVQRARVARSMWGHFQSRSVGNEISGYLHNDEKIHHLQGRIENEIEVYLNNQKTLSRRTR